MVELLIGIVVFIVAAGAIGVALVSTQRLNRHQAELFTAAEAAESYLEEMYAEDFADVFASFNADPADDPDGPGSALGSDFLVRGLILQAGDVDGFAGEVVFPVAGGQLREDLVDPSLGMPRDLDLDGAVDAGDYATSYRVLPLIVRVRWTGVAGPQVFELPYSLSSISD